jgi:hypothetical protein
VIGVDNDAFGLAVLDRHPERVDDQVRRGRRVDRPAHHSTREGVEDHGAVHLALAGGVLGDVGQPQAVGFGPGEVAIHEILSRWAVGDLAVLWSAGQPSETEPAHHQLDRAAGHAHVASEDELGVDTACPIGLAGVGVYDPDDVGDHRVAHRAR